MVKGYCLKCKAQRDVRGAMEVKMKNGLRAIKGSCDICGTGMYKIVGK